MADADNQDLERLRTLYAETTKLTTVFVEWRDKVMTRFFAVLTASVAMSGWFYQQPELRRWCFIPLALAALFSCFSALMDRVNTKLLQECCYPVGARLETALSESGGVFTAIFERRNSFFSYRRVLRIMYLSSAALFIALSIAVAAYVM